MPVIQDAGSLGSQANDPSGGGQQQSQSTSQFNAAMPTSSPDGDPTTAVGQAVNDQRMGAFSQMLSNYGVQGLGPQALERQTSTQSQLLDGMLQAMGLSTADLKGAYAQSQFANTGDANAI